MLLLCLRRFIILNCDRNQIIPNNNFLTFTPNPRNPECLDDLPVEDDHNNEREDVEEGSLDNGVDEARGIAPERTHALRSNDMSSTTQGKKIRSFK